MALPGSDQLQPALDRMVASSNASGALVGPVKVAEVLVTETGERLLMTEQRKVGARPLTVDLELVEQPTDLAQLLAMVQHQASVQDEQGKRQDEQQRSIDALAALPGFSALAAATSEQLAASANAVATRRNGRQHPSTLTALDRASPRAQPRNARSQTASIPSRGTPVADR
jgi:hypothetical protein